MKTIQIVIDEPLLKQIDRHCRGANRSAFFRRAAKELLRKLEVEQLEQKHKSGYAKYPVERKEFSVWEKEQVWTD